MTKKEWKSPELVQYGTVAHRTEMSRDSVAQAGGFILLQNGLSLLASLEV